MQNYENMIQKTLKNVILISNFLRQMRYRWNCHHSYIVNIGFLNNLVQKQNFFIFCIFVFIRYKGSPLGRVFLDFLCNSSAFRTKQQYDELYAERNICLESEEMLCPLTHKNCISLLSLFT